MTLSGTTKRLSFLCPYLFVHLTILVIFITVLVDRYPVGNLYFIVATSDPHLSTMS